MNKNDYNGFEIGDEVMVSTDRWSRGTELGRIVVIVGLSDRVGKPWVQAIWENRTYGFYPADLRKVTKLDKVLK